MCRFRIVHFRSIWDMRGPNKGKVVCDRSPQGPPRSEALVGDVGDREERAGTKSRRGACHPPPGRRVARATSRSRHSASPCARTARAAIGRRPVTVDRADGTRPWSTRWPWVVEALPDRECAGGVCAPRQFQRAALLDRVAHTVEIEQLGIGLRGRVADIDHCGMRRMLPGPRCWSRGEGG